MFSKPLAGVIAKFFYPRSLSGRLRFASCLLLPMILGITALILEQAFSQSLEAATKERLRLQTYVLLGAAEAGGGELWMPSALQEPRFSQPGSDLYGLVSDADGRLLWRSPSTLGSDLNFSLRLKNVDKPQFGRNSEGLFYFSYPVVWETEDGRETPFLFTSMEVPTSYEAELGSFRVHLWGGLSLLALLLLLAQGLILRWGLNPLMNMAEDLKAIEQGESDKLQGRYPKEVAPITANLNLLLEGERRQRERYRNTLADLAHSLKTPLAVIRNIANGYDCQEVDKDVNKELADCRRPRQSIAEQIDRMDQIISHQLGRATATPAHNLLKPIAIKPAAERIGHALEKIYRETFQSFAVIGPDLAFKGDERDLMEILGNLIDNAFKYGGGEVKVILAETEADLIIRVEDNGAGVSADLHQAIMQRGMRADSQQQGQGIGLSVVRDILAGYEGKLDLNSSAMGGAAFRLRLPK
ncbi:ATP-binding protein [Motiliproteus sp. MSK22-1]|uniref:ATP-binding protein n=1 Tax=Motiliproteus sp. MSK22-1 TaxID=1897630 RepID=UPI0009F8157F|nr:ATP-binding protein [Motiliproteus sp. MSK22-1]